MERTSALVLFKTLAIVLLLFIFSPNFSYASLSACSATVSPDSININSSGNSLAFTVTNEDNSENVMRWFQVSPPSGDYSLESNSFFTGFEALPNNSVVQVVSVGVGNTPSSSQNWTVQAADNSDGIGATTCTGNLGTSIIDASPPQISNVVVSSITNTSVIISWTTNKNATSELNYGETDSYGFTKSDSIASTSHSYTIESLSANTTYHFNIKATDEMGTSELGDNSFTTAATASVTAAPQVITNTVTTTRTITITPTPTPTPIPDITKPTVYISTDFSKPFLEPPQIAGTAKDNKSVVKIEYSLDGGKNWIQADFVSSLNKASTGFSFIPPPLDDGNYELLVRAIDASGNNGLSKKYTLVIDRLVPQVSGVLFSLGPQIINPRTDGSLVVLKNQPIKITLSDVGGATSIDIFIDDPKKLNSKKFSLLKNADSGLWSGNISFPQDGEYQLRFSAVDGAGNKTDRNLNQVIVVKKGVVNAKNAKLTVYFQDPLTNNWMIWDGKPYLQENPQKVDVSGNFSLFLPTGKYYLHMEASGFQSTDSEFFNITTSMPINADFSLKPLKILLDLGSFRLYWPDFSISTVSFKNNLPESLGVNTLIDKQAPFFNLLDKFSIDSLKGKPSILTFINTWSPQSLEQVSILDKFSKKKDFNSATIVEGEKSSRVYVFQKRGEYSLTMLADPDASLVSLYNLNVLPATYFLDRKGVIRKIISGALNEQELENVLENIAQ